MEHCSQGATPRKVEPPLNKLGDLHLDFGNGSFWEYIHHQKEVEGGPRAR